MKNLFKLFTAVAVAMFTFSCATDSTADLGIEVGKGGGKTTITLSLEESRTQLGEATEGVYPLYWSEGDQISINGVASQPLTAEQAGKASATFTVEVEAENYQVAYPAADEGKVVFAENQTHTANNTFGNGVTTMYASCAANSNIALKHLTGVLKIGVTGSATLTHAQISTIDRAPIAGSFALDFENGEVTATDNSKSVINYSFGEGIALTSEPTYLHIAVPAGTYDELYVTLYDNAQGVMYATVKADDTNPLSAGDIRYFRTNIDYAATDKVFVIKSEADLKAFAAAAATTTLDVVFANDIELTEAWTSIEGYAGTVYGHGYAIKGLTAPLFGTTSASIKGLHLEGVAINETTTPNVGTFARAIVATDSVKPVLENCSVEGTLTVNCSAYTLVSDTIGEFAIGGLVGCVKGVDISNCVSNVAIDVDQVIATSNTTNIYMSVAGVVGLVNTFERTDTSVVLSNLSNCENNGAIDVYEVSYTTSSYDGGTVVPYVAGIAARFASGNGDCKVSNLTNRGDITVAGIYGKGADGTAQEVDYSDIDPCIGGVAGYLATAEGSNLKNYGEITYNNGRLWFLYLGGVVGMVGKNSVLTGLENYGAITLPYAEGNQPKVVSLHCAGIVAHTLTDTSLSESNNYGKITIVANISVGGASGHRYFRVGGVSAFSCGAIENCHNQKGANIDISGSLGGAPSWQDYAIGGVVAVAYHHSVTNCSNNAVIKSGMNNTSTNAKHLGHTNLGGVVGIASQPCSNVTNNGRFIFLGNTKILYMGGCVGYLGASDNTTQIGGYTNNGEFEFRGTTGTATTSACAISGTARIGGCVGMAAGTIYNATNNVEGKIVLNSVKHAGTCYIGGIAGYASAGIHTANNYAPLNLANITLVKYYVGGISPVIQKGASELTNHSSAEIVVDFCPESSDVATTTYISGIGGYLDAESSNFLNQGNITVNGTYNGLTLIAGISANAAAAVALTGMKNEGDITINATVTASSHYEIGGLQADNNQAQTWTDCYNKGNITISKSAKTTGSNQLRVGGFFGGIRGTAVGIYKNCYNSGTITVEEGAESVAQRIGGFAGWIEKSAPSIDAADGFRSNGNIYVYNGATVTANNYVGGAVGYLSSDSNSATISNAQVVCDIVAIGATGAGMIVGSGRSETSKADKCKLGGRIATEMSNSEPVYKTILESEPTPEYDANGDPVPSENDNKVAFWNAIYGITWSDASDSNCDGCLYLSTLTIE